MGLSKPLTASAASNAFAQKQALLRSMAATYLRESRLLFSLRPFEMCSAPSGPILLFQRLQSRSHQKASATGQRPATDTQIHRHLHSFVLCSLARNMLNDEAARYLSDALKVNTALKELKCADSASMQHLHVCKRQCPSQNVLAFVQKASMAADALDKCKHIWQLQRT